VPRALVNGVCPALAIGLQATGAPGAPDDERCYGRADAALEPARSA
jgi:hypothetical protein